MGKHLSFFVALVCATVAIGFGQGFYGVHSPNSIDVWAVGRNGNVFHSFDGGITWTSSTQGAATLRSVFTMNTHVWIVGDNGAFYSSSNSGSNWDTQSFSGGATLWDIVFTDEQNGWTAGNNGVLFRTTDSGASWNAQASGTSQQLNALAFVDVQTGYVAGAAGTLLKTTNGGVSWVSCADAGWTKEILSVSASGQAVYVVGVDGFSYKSTNGGVSWQGLKFYTDSRSDVSGVFVKSADSVCFVGGGGYIRTTSNGGGGFDYGLHGMLAKLNDVFFVNGQTGWACSEMNNAVLRTSDGGATWSLPQGTTVSYAWQQKFSASSIGNTFMINPWNKDRIYVVTGSTVHMSANRGETWSVTGSIGGGGSTHSFYISPKDTNKWVAAITGPDRVAYSTNRGVSWTTTITSNFTSYGMPLEMDPDHPDTLLFAPDGTSGANGVVYRSTKFGLIWDTLAVTSFRSPCDILIVPDSTNIVYVGDGVTGSGNAQMWRSTNGGVNWTSVYTTSGSEIPMISISRMRNTEAYATAWGSGGVNKTSNFGVSWPTVASTGSTWGTDVAKDDPNVAMYGTYGGSTSYLSTNGGASFISTPLTGSNSGMLCYDRSTFLAQQTGSVWKYNITYTVPVSNVQALGVVSPNGGENWAYNTTQNIMWTASNIANVKIEYKTGPTAPWQTITASTPATSGSYAWLIPNTPTTQARVRVSDALDTTPLDSSNGYFSITVAAISSLPTSLAFGTTVVGSTRQDTIRIFNSGTGTLVVTSVTTGSSNFLAGRGSFTIPPGSSDTLSVLFRPTATQSYSDTLRINSNAGTGPYLVSLSGDGGLAAALAVISPNGGEVWEGNSVHNITWSAVLIDTVTIQYKAMPANRWSLVALDVPAASASYSWTVPNTASSEVYVRIVSQPDGAVVDESDNSFEITSVTSVVENVIPLEFALMQNYPNPFNPSTLIVYDLPKETHVSLRVYNSLGQEVALLVDEVQTVGRYSVQFSARTQLGAALSSGIYFYKLKAGDFLANRKMLLIK
ncbi:MAG TPA: YCF48-related protein [Bacteroidota bacterium]|nr:YCF48-related protein [Bacteroidota bacterium]